MPPGRYIYTASRIGYFLDDVRGRNLDRQLPCATGGWHTDYPYGIVMLFCL